MKHILEVTEFLGYELLEGFGSGVGSFQGVSHGFPTISLSSAFRIPYSPESLLGEKAVLDWIIHLGLLAQPLDQCTIGPYVKDICGSFPGKNWLQRFLAHNEDAVRYCRTASLDPKHAQSFNYPTFQTQSGYLHQSFISPSPSFPMGSEEWDLQSAGQDTESDTSSDLGEDITTSLHNNLPIPPMTPANSQWHNKSDHPTPQHTPTATPQVISTHHTRISSSLSKERLINIALTLHDEKEAAEADAGRARAHASIVGRKYTQLQQEILARECAPEASHKSFATTARVMNTAEALNQIEAAFFKCVQRVAKHFHNLQARAEKQIEREQKEQLTQEARAAARAAKAVKAAEKAAAREAEQEWKALAKAKKAALTAASKGHKGTMSRGKRKMVSDDKENEINSDSAPPISNHSPKRHRTASPQPSIASPSRHPPWYRPCPQPAWVGTPGYSAMHPAIASGMILRYAKETTPAIYPGPPPPLVAEPAESSGASHKAARRPQLEASAM
ncbi:hypothetical protein BS47DRAFT_1399636 [Hydnum rufescens UP504]|uniref:Uncharacterized protein n=1 Tax=Hydnum rufescens UP504 TaxID=1448309 RepID=A0A9P6DPH8_9AGAM|nr:hypothetical protein BS47DRAFT_1399636 [Hydnum rufescens UP504]